MSPRLPARLPVSSYRLQFAADFGFARAAEVVSYLQRLGVTDCYSAPVLESAPGSTHGYDVCDHGRIDAALGGEGQFAAFAGEVRRQGLGLILDFVPNHMSVHAETNAWWRSVLENGPSSPFARYFDIDWDPVKDELKGKGMLTGETVDARQVDGREVVDVADALGSVPATILYSERLEGPRG